MERVLLHHMSDAAVGEITMLDETHALVSNNSANTVVPLTWKNGTWVRGSPINLSVTL
jgi:hypothetical protein